MSNNHRKVFVYMLEQYNSTYWLKKCGEDKRNAINRLINFYLRHKKNRSHLVLTSGLSPKERFKKEVTLLDYANKHGLSTPDLIFKGRSFFITKNAGEPIHRQDEKRHTGLFMKATDVLCDFHRHNMIHGRPAMRDIVVNEEGKVTFLDLEEARISSNPTLRTRDFLLFLLDSYRLKQVSDETRLRALLHWYQEFGQGTEKAFRLTETVLNRFSWIAKLVLMVRKKNRLSEQLLALRQLLKRFEQEKHRLATHIALDH
ncbi:hypothetical protein LDJ79_20355 [Vibrio tritonius]|uniref:Serine/threonine protein kinase n=1 Tax=Vibrio tritonius TaxID=1435069 RepID=A0ABS7YS10_9VIBR|nr:hypothetical protein [Vibrio tritonius]MCA2018480.1 hypothetical protein [Vibrio tritonius]